MRTIPTHVGRTPDGISYRTRNPDHPHARGENGYMQQHPTTQCGPSPRTWGERATSSRHIVSSWTIPTHVGRTGDSVGGKRIQPDHPHARGENTFREVDQPASDGPSPRTWGEPIRGIPGRAVGRTIPTHVGRTKSQSPWEREEPDHPHARGENTIQNVRTVLARGPSPRTWGEHTQDHREGEAGRTIPTHVGRTLS